MTQNDKDPRFKPSSMTLNRELHEFQISWADGKTTTYNLDMLREACPCASCRGGTQEENELNIIPLTSAQSYKLVNIEQVGRYAIQLTWSDGHNTGIYTWSYLRELHEPDRSSAEYDS